MRHSIYFCLTTEVMFKMSQIFYSHSAEDKKVNNAVTVSLSSAILVLPLVTSSICLFQLLSDLVCRI